MPNRPGKLPGRIVIRLAMAAGFTLAFTGAPAPVSAEDASIRERARMAGHAAGSVARDIGQGASKVGKTVGGVAKEGGKEFRRALKGQSG